MNTLASLLNIGVESREQKAKRFYTALGEFVCTFARAEVAMYILLHHLLKLTDWKARALIGGQNMGMLVSLTKRIAPKCLGPKKLKELNLLLTQLEIINQFRHDLIHRGADISEKDIRSSNFWSAKTNDAIEEMVLEIDHVTGADFDLGCIMVRIYLLAFRKKVGKMTTTDRKMFFAPWRYKPLARQNMTKRLLGEALTRPRQPQSSPQ